MCKESLEICNDSVKCQKCGIAVPLLRAVIKTRSNRIDALQKQIKWIENYSCGKINRPSYVNEVKALKQELAELLEEDAKADKLRSLPLYSCRITGWKFVCSGVMIRSTTACWCRDPE